LRLHILGAIAEFEWAQIAERVRAGLARVRGQGKVLGRSRKTASAKMVATARRLPAREGAAELGVSVATDS
jgi:DNA invertase Pin-like site-specific DNA recombinase